MLFEQIKLKRKLIIEILVYVYVVLLMFGGIITRLLMRAEGLFKVKSILPEVTLILIIILAGRDILKKNREKYLKFYVFVWLYFIAVFILNFLKGAPINKMLFILRDTIFPLMAGYALIKVDFTKEEKEKIIRRLLYICILQVVSGFGLGIIERQKDWSWTSKFYRGYEFYGLDEVSNVKIWHSNGNLRVPSVAGNSVLFAFYNYISYLVIKHSNSKFKLPLIALCFGNIFISTTKTVIIVVVIDLIIMLFMKSKAKIKGIILIGIT